MNTHNVELRLVPTTSSIDLNKVSTSIQEIYEQVGVRVNIDIKPVFDISAYLENDQLPTVKDDKLSTYSGAQQRLFTDYQSKNALDKAYYLFVTDKASSTGVEGYMRLNGQYGFVFNAVNDKEIGRTAAHELGHGAFRLEHPFVEYKKDLKEGNTNSLMDYQTTSTSFIYTNWRQINDPKLKFYTFQGQSEGEHVDGNFELTEDSYFMTPSNKIFQLPKGSIVNFYKVNSPQKVVNGAIYGFTLPNKSSYQVKFNQLNYTIQFGSTKFSGYYQEMGDEIGPQYLDQKNYQVGKYPVYLILLIHEETVNGAIHYKYNIVKADIDITNINIKSSSNFANDPFVGDLTSYKNPVVIKEITQVLNYKGAIDEVAKIESGSKRTILTVFFNKETQKYSVEVELKGKPANSEVSSQEKALKSQIKKLAEEKLNQLGGLAGKDKIENGFKEQTEDGGEFYVKDMNGREWLKTIGDLGESVWENAAMPKSYWNKDEGYDTATIHVPPTFAGVGDGVIEEVTNYPQLVKLAYDVSTKKDVRNGLWESVKGISVETIKDAAVDFYEEKKANYTSDKSYIVQHTVSKDAVQVASMLFTGGGITKGLKEATDNVDDGVKKAGNRIKKEALEKATKDFLKDFDQTFVDKLKKIPNYDKVEAALVESWKKHHGSKFSLQHIYDENLVNKIKGFELKVHSDGNFTADMVLKGGLGAADKFVEFKSWKTGSFTLLNGTQYKNQLKSYMQSGNFEQIFDANKLIKDGVTNPDNFVKQKIVDMIKKNPEEFKDFFPNKLKDINELGVNSEIIQRFVAK